MDPFVEDPRELVSKKSLTFNSLEKFPPEWLEYIFTFITGFQLHPLLRVCKRWNGLVSDRWLSEVGETKELRQRKREYYFKKEKFSILFTSAEMVRINGTTLSFVRISCKVQPRELGHSVGIVYTCDDWKTVYKWYGFWSSNSPDEQEEYWKIRLWCFPNDAKIQFAVHAQDARGVRVWDNNNACNYEIRIKEIPKVTEYLWNWVQH